MELEDILFGDSGDEAVPAVEPPDAGPCKKRAVLEESVGPAVKREKKPDDSVSWAERLRDAFAMTREERGRQRHPCKMMSLCTGLATHNRAFEDCDRASKTEPSSDRSTGPFL